MRYHSVIGPHGIGPPHLPPHLARSSDTGTPLVHHNLPLPPLRGSATHNTYSLAAYGPTRLPAIAGQPPASAPAQAPATGTSHQLQVSATHGLHTVATGQLRRTQLPHTRQYRSSQRASSSRYSQGGSGQGHAPQAPLPTTSPARRQATSAAADATAVTAAIHRPDVPHHKRMQHAPQSSHTALCMLSQVLPFSPPLRRTALLVPNPRMGKHACMHTAHSLRRHVCIWPETPLAAVVPIALVHSTP